MTSSLRIKIYKLTNLVIFHAISIITVAGVFMDVISLIINQCDPFMSLINVTPLWRLADTKCPPAAQRKQAKRACVYIYIYICNELIAETARDRKLIFGMWGFLSIAPVSSELTKMSTHNRIMTSLSPFYN